ncbi:MAG: signal peptide peptidase SppA [Pseudomonadota bacterium]
MAGFASRLNNGLTTLRQWVVNLFTLGFLIYLIVIAVIVSRQVPPTVDPEGRVLIIAPEGVIVDQEVIATRLSFPPDLSAQTQINYRDLVRVIRAAAKDERLQAVSIDFSQAGVSGVSTLLGLAEELSALRDADIPLIAFGDVVGTGAYLLAAQANEVYMHSAGALNLAGLGGKRPFVSELAGNLKVTFHDYSFGEYKSAQEGFTRTDMSEADRRQTRALLDPIWAGIKESVATARDIAPEQIQRYVDEHASVLGGGGAYKGLNAAQELGLVDGFKTFPEYRRFMRERFGTDPEAERETYPHITAGAYLAQLDAETSEASDAVSVVFLQGLITRGEIAPGSAGADATAALIRKAYEDEDTRALVLRVNSPGGTVLASEMIREEMIAARERGLPVIVSMGDVAASGGMLASAPASRIFAQPTTITGSIGVALAIPTLEDAMEYIGVNYDGVVTSRFAGWSTAQGIDANLDADLRAQTELSYRSFVQAVADGRERSYDEIEAIAQGIVWLGDAALEVGLVDELGDLEAAVEAAAAQAELATYRVAYVVPELSPGARFLRDLMQQVPIRVGDDLLQIGSRLAEISTLFTSEAPRITLMCSDCELELSSRTSASSLALAQ